MIPNATEAHTRYTKYAKYTNDYMNDYELPNRILTYYVNERE